MRVLVTGATGFLGGWLARRLRDEGHDVRIIARPSSDFDDIKDLKLETHHGDVTNLESLTAACADVDTVFHLAGLVAYTRAQRAAMERVNVLGTENVLKACEARGVRKLIHMSSVVAVGAGFSRDQILDETSPFNLHHLNLGYFETKLAAEKLVCAAVEKGALEAVMINPSTIYGPADAKKGSRGVQLKVARGKFPFFPPGGVSVVAVEDVVDATIAAWTKGRNGERYIVSGENLLLKDVFDLIAAEAGVKAPSIAMPRAALFALGKLGDALEKIGKKGPLNTENAWTSVLYHWFNASKAQREFDLKFKPAAHAIERSVRWSRDHGLLK